MELNEREVYDIIELIANMSHELKFNPKKFFIRVYQEYYGNYFYYYYNNNNPISICNFYLSLDASYQSTLIREYVTYKNLDVDIENKLKEGFKFFEWITYYLNIGQLNDISGLTINENYYDCGRYYKPECEDKSVCECQCECKKQDKRYAQIRDIALELELQGATIDGRFKLYTEYAKYAYPTSE